MTKSNSPEPPAQSDDITLLLQRISAGDAGARSDLMRIMYPDLRRIAEHRMSSERGDHTLQPTALVNEFFLELARQRGVSWRNRRHFLAVASKAMRRFLIDYARAHMAQRRGGGAIKLRLDDFDIASSDAIDAILVDDVLERLMVEEPRMANIVELRCFGGLAHAEIADILEIDERTVRRDWQIARAWLYGQLKRSAT